MQLLELLLLVLQWEMWEAPGRAHAPPSGLLPLLPVFELRQQQRRGQGQEQRQGQQLGRSR